MAQPDGYSWRIEKYSNVGKVFNSVNFRAVWRNVSGVMARVTTGETKKKLTECIVLAVQGITLASGSPSLVGIEAEARRTIRMVPGR